MSKSRVIFSIALVCISVIGFAGGAAIANQLNERSEERRKEEILEDQANEDVDTFDLTVGSEENNQNMNNDNQQTTSPAAQSDDTEVVYDTSIPGLKFRDIELGDGKEVQSGDTVRIHYEGTLTSDGSKFDSSYDRGTPFTSPIGVGRLIQGWDLGVPGMKEGGKRELIISPELGYGEAGAGAAIPPNAELKFIVEVVEVLG